MITIGPIEKLIAIAFAAALLISVSDVKAGGYPQIEAQQQQHQRQGQTANGGASSATSGASSSSLTDAARNSMYIFPNPVYATPLPGNLCPQGDSLAWSIGWNFFSYAVSSTRTEIECLDKWLAANRVSVAPPAPAVVVMVPRKRKAVHPCYQACRAVERKRQ